MLPRKLSREQALGASDQFPSLVRHHFQVWNDLPPMRTLDHVQKSRKIIRKLKNHYISFSTLEAKHHHWSSLKGCVKIGCPKIQWCITIVPMKMTICCGTFWDCILFYKPIWMNHEAQFQLSCRRFPRLVAALFPPEPPGPR